MNLKLPFLDEVVFINFLYAFLFLFIVNYVLILMNVLQEINFLALIVLSVMFVYFKIQKYLKVIFK